MPTIGKIIFGLTVVCLALAMAGASAYEQMLRVPLLEVGTLWLNALQGLGDKCRTILMHITDLSSPWSYVGLGGVTIILYYLYKLLCAPMNRVRKLGSLGYIPEDQMSSKEVANLVRKRRQAGDCPPVYPNGWFSVLESRVLKPAQVENVACLGLHLAVFRGEDGRAHVVDAYCPHLGANMGVGGRVVGDCIECPFHGWKFRGDDGKCTHIPYCEDKHIPKQADVKSYNVLEKNGFIYIWYHAEAEVPNWLPPDVEEVNRGEWTYRGRTEHYVNSHIEEVPENGADVAHLLFLHGPIMTTGIDLRFTHTSKFWSFAKHDWDGGWTENTAEGESHIGTLNLKHAIHLFGVEIPILNMTVKARQIGPGIVYLTYESLFGRGAFLQSLTPVEPLLQRMVHHLYFHWTVPTFIAKFFMYGEAMMVERDIMVWNNKRYEGKPVFVKSKEDQTIAKHRRWYSQFYSEHSPRYNPRKDTLDW